MIVLLHVNVSTTLTNSSRRSSLTLQVESSLSNGHFSELPRLFLIPYDDRPEFQYVLFNPILSKLFLPLVQTCPFAKLPMVDHFFHARDNQGTDVSEPTEIIGCLCSTTSSLKQFWQNRKHASFLCAPLLNKILIVDLSSYKCDAFTFFSCWI